MFFKPFVLITPFLVTLAAATPTRRGGELPNQCDTGSIQCCDSVQSAESPGFTSIFSSLGIDVSSLNGLVGATCTPITVIGAGGDSCSASPVCCENNSFNGVVALGCTPINLNL